jgi:hypothetical protein
MTLAEAALDYCARGWSVIPMRCDGDEKNRKRPAISAWEEFQHCAADVTQVRAWWRQDPNFNIGIVTGSVSRLVVLDLDGPNAVALLKARGFVLPPTAAAQTGKGFHAYFSYQGEVLSNRAKLLSDGRGSAVDVRAEGGCVVAPPSVHGSGRGYSWSRGLDALKPLPPELEEWLLGGDVETPQVNGDWWESVKDGVDTGARNDVAARVAGYWLRLSNGNEDAALRATILWNAQNRPPLDEVEIKRTVASVAKRDQLHRKAEAARSVPRQPVITGGAWANELQSAGPRKGEVVGIPGFGLISGLVPGDLVVIAGRPGMGKSTLATQLTAQACLQRHIPTWIVSSEMSRGQWGRWMATVAAGCKYRDLPHPLPQDILDQFRQAPIGITDAGTISISEIRSLAEGRQGVKLVIVDHIGRISGNRRDNRVLEVGDVARGLKSLARDLECTVVALCQLNRAIEARDSRRPRLSDLRESGEVEQEADAVFFLYSPTEIKKDAPTREMILALEKHRYGPLRNLKLEFRLEERRFVEAEGN